jgi:hypothetical protein
MVPRLETPGPPRCRSAPRRSPSAARPFEPRLLVREARQVGGVPDEGLEVGRRDGSSERRSRRRTDVSSSPGATPLPRGDFAAPPPGARRWSGRRRVRERCSRSLRARSARVVPPARVPHREPRLAQECSRRLGDAPLGGTRRGTSSAVAVRGGDDENPGCPWTLRHDPGGPCSSTARETASGEWSAAAPHPSAHQLVEPGHPARQRRSGSMTFQSAAVRKPDPQHPAGGQGSRRCLRLRRGWPQAECVPTSQRLPHQPSSRRPVGAGAADGRS